MHGLCEGIADDVPAPVPEPIPEHIAWYLAALFPWHRHDFVQVRFIHTNPYIILGPLLPLSPNVCAGRRRRARESPPGQPPSTAPNPCTFQPRDVGVQLGCKQGICCFELGRGVWVSFHDAVATGTCEYIPVDVEIDGFRRGARVLRHSTRRFVNRDGKVQMTMVFDGDSWTLVLEFNHEENKKTWPSILDATRTRKQQRNTSDMQAVLQKLRDGGVDIEQLKRESVFYSSDSSQIPVRSGFTTKPPNMVYHKTG